MENIDSRVFIFGAVIIIAWFGLALLLTLRDYLKDREKFMTAYEDAIQRNERCGRLMLKLNNTSEPKKIHKKYGKLEMKVRGTGGMKIIFMSFLACVFLGLYNLEVIPEDTFKILILFVGVIYLIIILMGLRTIKFYEYGIVYQGTFCKFKFTYNDIVYIDTRRVSNTEDGNYRNRRGRYVDKFDYYIYLLNKKRLNWNDSAFYKLEDAISLYHKFLCDERGEIINKPQNISFSFHI